MEFTGKKAVVTGAASGMGFLTARELALSGAVVALLDVDPAAVEVAAARIQGEGGTAVPYTVDIQRYDQITGALEDFRARFSRIDIVVNSAGGASCRVFHRTETFKDIPVEDLDWGIDVNLKGPLYMARAVMGIMVEQRSGVIVNIGSIDGETGGTCVDYSAAKSGVMYGLTKSLALYGAPYGVRTCCVSPGPVLTRPAMAKMKTPLGRAAEPMEVVRLIIYLCSDDAAFITGSNYFIDGGRSCGAQN